MIVKKCDRCGEVFSSENLPDIFKFLNLKTVKQVHTANRYGQTVDAFDLCDSCIEDFNEWMKGETE